MSSVHDSVLLHSPKLSVLLSEAGVEFVRVMSGLQHLGVPIFGLHGQEVAGDDFGQEADDSAWDVPYSEHPVAVRVVSKSPEHMHSEQLCFGFNNEPEVVEKSGVLGCDGLQLAGRNEDKPKTLLELCCVFIGKRMPLAAVEQVRQLKCSFFFVLFILFRFCEISHFFFSFYTKSYSPKVCRIS